MQERGERRPREYWISGAEEKSVGKYERERGFQVFEGWGFDCSEQWAASPLPVAVCFRCIGLPIWSWCRDCVYSYISHIDRSNKCAYI
jgi:hypothetical protein